MSSRVAHKLAKHHNPEHIQEKMAYLAYLLETRPETINSPTGWLRRAIEQDYAAPDGYATPAQQVEAQKVRQAEEEALERHIQETAAFQQAKREREAQGEEERIEQLNARYGTTGREVAIWQETVNELLDQMPSATFDAYVAGSVLLAVQEGQALIGSAQRRRRYAVAA
jgi:predicted DNA-binding protein